MIRKVKIVVYISIHYSTNNEDATMTWRCAWSQVLAVSVKNLVLLAYGMTLGFPTLLIPVLSRNNKEEPFFLGDEGISWVGK